ncbi:MAG: antibiotic biosynthesis monooxygenase, partial [Alphaproteobacteria bacterium]
YSTLYLSPSRNRFDFSATDDHALSKIKYRLDYGPEVTFTSLMVASEIKSTSGTIVFDFSSLSPGYHNAFLIVEDGLENRVEVPYRFYFDKSAPNIDAFEIINIEPTTTAGEYKVEFNLRICDDIVVEIYEIYDDEAAFEAHKAAPHYHEFNHAIDGMVMKKSVRFLQNISHHA